MLSLDVLQSVRNMPPSDQIGEFAEDLLRHFS
jgi:hypothetical protein